MENNSVKEPWYAVLLSVFIPGAGQLYCKKYPLAIIFFVCSWGSILSAFLIISTVKNSFIYSVLLFFVGLSIFGFNIINAFFCAKKNNSEESEQERKSAKDPWLAVFLSHLLPGLGLIYIKNFLIGIVLLIIAVGIQLLTDTNKLLNYSLIAVLTVAAVIITYYVAPVKRETSFNKITLIAGLIIFSTGITSIIPVSVIQAFYIPTPSMENTLYTGDHVFIKKTSNYQPQRGDIVIYIPQDEKDKFYIKRCIAVSGDIFAIKNGSVYINNSKLKETYIKSETFFDDGMTLEQFNDLAENDKKKTLLTKRVINGGTVPKNMTVLLGDNRTNSRDSRFHGYVSANDIKGKLLGIYWNTADIMHGNLKRFGSL